MMGTHDDGSGKMVKKMRRKKDDDGAGTEEVSSEVVGNV